MNRLMMSVKILQQHLNEWKQVPDVSDLAKKNASIICMLLPLLTY
jgi:hypothetical protein